MKGLLEAVLNCNDLHLFPFVDGVSWVSPGVLIVALGFKKNFTFFFFFFYIYFEKITEKGEGEIFHLCFTLQRATTARAGLDQSQELLLGPPHRL